jgi:hypothetical protein
MMKKEPINNVRIVIPINISDKLDLAKKVNEKTEALGASSPLASLDWATQGPNIAIALEVHNEAEDLRRKMEKLYEQRDTLLYPIDDLLKQSRDLLKAVYRKEPFKIGDFGYNVNSTPPKNNNKKDEE